MPAMREQAERPARRSDAGSELARGDRLPNFVLPDRFGEGVMIYESVQGLPLIVLLHRAVGRASDRVLLERLDAAVAGRAHLFAVSPEPAEAQRGLAAQATLLVDATGRIGEQLRAGAVRGGAGVAPDAPMILVADPNQRLLGVLPGGDATAVVGEVRRLLEAPAPRVGAGKVWRAAPALIVPDVLDEAACARLIALWEGGHDEGKVAAMVDGQRVDRINYGTKRRLDHAISDPGISRDLARTVSRRVGPELAKAFHLQAFRFEPFIVMAYDAERRDFFRPHRDNHIPDLAGRRFALTLNLNTGDYEGGDLRFPEYGPEVYAPPAGGALLFSCSLLHEALPVTRGRRYAVLSFLRTDGVTGRPGA